MSYRPGRGGREQERGRTRGDERNSRGRDRGPGRERAPRSNAPQRKSSAPPQPKRPAAAESEPQPSFGSGVFPNEREPVKEIERPKPPPKRKPEAKPEPSPPAEKGGTFGAGI